MFCMIAQLWNTNTPAFVSCDADQTEIYMYISMKFRKGVHVFCWEVGVFNRSPFQSVSYKSCVFIVWIDTWHHFNWSYPLNDKVFYSLVNPIIQGPIHRCERKCSVLHFFTGFLIVLQAWGTDTGNWTEDNIYDAQRILVGLTAAELDNLPLSVDVIYAMGQYDNWDTAQVGIRQTAWNEICSPYVSKILKLITITWF